MCQFFFFNDTATTEIYTLSLHDALPICPGLRLRDRRGAHIRDERVDRGPRAQGSVLRPLHVRPVLGHDNHPRSEEHTSELQSRQYLVCRLLLEKKKRNSIVHTILVLYDS